MIDREYLTENKTELINDLITAIKGFNENPAALENFECYLNIHFVTWCEKYATTPDNFINELNHFSKI